MGDFNKDRDKAAHIHLNEYKNLLLKNNPPAIEPVWGSFCYGADWGKDWYDKKGIGYLTKWMKDTHQNQLKAILKMANNNNCEDIKQYCSILTNNTSDEENTELKVQNMTVSEYNMAHEQQDITGLRKHKWEPIKESKGRYGYHMYKCSNCGKDTHIGLDIDYEAKECPGTSQVLT